MLSAFRPQMFFQCLWTRGLFSLRYTALRSCPTSSLHCMTSTTICRPPPNFLLKHTAFHSSPTASLYGHKRPLVKAKTHKGAAKRFKALKSGLYKRVRLLPIPSELRSGNRIDLALCFSGKSWQTASGRFQVSRSLEPIRSGRLRPCD